MKHYASTRFLGGSFSCVGDVGPLTSLMLRIKLVVDGQSEQ